jgi:hypothetical protein
MALDLAIAGNAIPTDVAALKSFPNNLNLAFSLDSTLNMTSQVWDVLVAAFHWSGRGAEKRPNRNVYLFRPIL